MPVSLVIRGGTVYDGLGGPGRTADLAIDGDRIAAVGAVPDTDGVRQIDATGLAVAPGFINILSHAWGTLQVEPQGPSDLLQGVTTEIFGEGLSLGPSNDDVQRAIAAEREDGQRMDFARLSEGLDYLESRGVAPNVASFVGGHNLRIIGGGLSDGPLSAQALDRLRGILDEEMADGALGIGTALIYPPGSFASTAELVALSEVVARHDGLYISHMRSEADQFLECLEELIEIGRRAGVRTEVYHLKAAGRANWPKMSAAIERIEAARAAGQATGANMYPYTAGGTALSSAIPPPYHDGGPAALAARLADPARRAAMARDIAEPSDAWENLYLAAGGGQSIMLTSGSEPDERLDGRWLADVAAERGRSDIDTLLDVAAASPAMSAMYFMIDENNLQLGLRQPWVSIGSDAGAAATRPPWTDRPIHPRTYGTYARVLGHYCRELGLFPLAEAVRRMTSLPADTLRLPGRGRLTPGAFADVAVFDPATVIDHASYDQPHVYAAGVRHVIVNGQPAVLDGELTGALPGRRLRRGA
ncbi:MAG TPA: D-aminoacylase [Streptosporangiaceae bacterium]|jgi:N-acyl-D-amino-acid deacylase